MTRGSCCRLSLFLLMARKEKNEWVATDQLTLKGDKDGFHNTEKQHTSNSSEGIIRSFLYLYICLFIYLSICLFIYFYLPLYVGCE